MPDMLVRLYDLRDAAPFHARAAASGVAVRRMEPWDRIVVRRFIERHFTENWAAEAEGAFSHGHPVTGFVAVKDGEIVGFAVYESTRRGFFGPTGVREDLRGNGVGAALLFRCLDGLRDLGYAYGIIGGVGPAAFYEKVCGAKIIEGSELSVFGSIYDEARERRRRRPDPSADNTD